jgi:2-alkenal reductase
VKRVVPALIENGRFDYPYLGVSSLSDEVLNLVTAETLGLPPDLRGAYVSCVTPGGPAEAAGVRGAGRCSDTELKPGGDLIIAIDGHPVRAFSDLISYLINHTAVDQTITLTVWRNGKQVDLAVTLEARP